jgi:hypothetical protein
MEVGEQKDKTLVLVELLSYQEDSEKIGTSFDLLVVDGFEISSGSGGDILIRSASRFVVSFHSQTRTSLCGANTWCGVYQTS